MPAFSGTPNASTATAWPPHEQAIGADGLARARYHGTVRFLLAGERVVKAGGQMRCDLHNGDAVSPQPDFSATSAFTLTFEVEHPDGSTGDLTLSDPLLYLSAFTGRDAEEIDRHLDELGELGVARPESVPTLYALPNWLLRWAGGTYQVATRMGSGEAEAVLLETSEGELFVTVGSDHTDREMEQTSIELSKLTCPKILATRAWPLGDVEDHWDSLVLRSSVDAGGADYQNELLQALLPPREILRLIHQRFRSARGRAHVVFLGTVPLKSTFRFDPRFTASLEDQIRERSLVCAYDVEVIDRQ